MSEEIYRQKILDHYRHPRNFGTLKKATHAAGHQNISCGDAVQFQVRIVKGRVADIAFTGEGCAVSIAAASMLSEFAKNKALKTILKMDKPAIEKIIGISVSGAREQCAMLGLETLKQLQKKKTPPSLEVTPNR